MCTTSSEPTQVTRSTSSSLLNLSEWNRKRELEVNRRYIEGIAYDPIVEIHSNIFPEQHEIYNCTTCINAERETPVNQLNTEKFRVKCLPLCLLWRVTQEVWSEGPRFGDIACPDWKARRGPLIL